MTTILINIQQLLQIREIGIKKVHGKEMNSLPLIENAFLLLKNDLIVDYGKMSDLKNLHVDKTIDCTSKIVMPTWCDSHTHLVFAANRDQEFVDRINGLTYEEIANRGGGILNSAQKLNETSFEILYANAARRLTEVITQGTGAIEIKSGYGLTFDGELKMLKIIQKLKQNFSIPIKATFLGAHAYPTDYKYNKSDYINLLINKMLPEIARQNLADFVDVFCETNYFSVHDAEIIIKAATLFGLSAKIHVNQFTAIGGIEMAVINNALSVDHLEILTDNDILALQNSKTMPVALPSCSFFISIPYTPARKIIDSGLPIALASDYNPGTSPSGNMHFVVATACIKMKMTPAESINAATINGAYAMGVANIVGSITRGKIANLIVTKPMEGFNEIPYLFSQNIIDQVFINGVAI